MSRSYKKIPIVKDNRKHSKEYKQIANRKLRKKLTEEETLKGNMYRKYTESWEIHDYSLYWPWQDAKKTWENDENRYLVMKCPTLESFRSYWVREMLGK